MTNQKCTLNVHLACNKLIIPVFEISEVNVVYSSLNKSKPVQPMSVQATTQLIGRRSCDLQ